MTSINFQQQQQQQQHLSFGKMMESNVSAPSAHPCTCSDSTTTKLKTVRFAPIIDVIEFEGPSYDRSMFYSKAEYAAMKMQRQYDVVMLHLRHVNGVEVTGIENYITPYLLEKTIRRKKKHMKHVLKEYKRQAKNGCCDVDKLAATAQMKSQWSVSRAFLIGNYQSKSSGGPNCRGARAA